MNKLNNILVATLVGFSLISCNEFAMQDMGTGYLSVGLQSDDSLQTKAAEAPAEGQIFSFDIYRGEAATPLIEVENHTEITEAFEVPADTYRIVAYSGAEQPAAWDSPFYKGETIVKVRPDVETTAEVVCTIENVVVSVELDDVFKNVIDDFTVKVDNGEAELVFRPEEVAAGRKAYFSVTGNLNWSLEFKNRDGKPYSSNGSYTDVKANQHYKLQFSVSEPEKVDKGEAGIKITVDDSINPAEEFTANLFFGLTDYPNIMSNAEFDISGEVSFPEGDVAPKVLTAIAKNGISRLLIRQRGESMNVSNYSMWYDLVEASDDEVAEMNAAGIKAASVAYGASSATMTITDYIGTLKMGKHVLEAVVYDIMGHKTEKVINLNVQSGVDATAYMVESNLNSSVITALWYGDSKPAGLGLEYRKVGDPEWIKVEDDAVSFNEAEKTFSARLTGLEVFTQYEFRPYSDNDKDLKPMAFRTQKVEAVSAQPWGKFAVVIGKCHETSNTDGLYFQYRKYGTTGWIDAEKSVVRYDSSSNTFTGEIWGLDSNSDYEFRAMSDDAGTDQLDYMEFTTESSNTVYNLSFDDWWLDGKVWYPYAQGANPTVWDSANKGSAGFGFPLTDPVEGEGNAVRGKAVKMESKYAAIAFAAGNLYTGKFGEVDALKGGATLEWGIPFDSRPLALKGYYKYAPKAIDRTKGDNMAQYKGQMDKMQIQIFIATWDKPFPISTTEGKFVDLNSADIVAFGRIESDVAYDTYQEFIIPLEYRSLTKKPTYIVISACSSYLGDYFTGGEGSALWVDEFSLEYDPANLSPAEREKIKYRN